MNERRKKEHHNLVKRIGVALENTQQRTALANTVSRARNARFDVPPDFEEKRLRARESKEVSIDGLTENLSIFTQKIDSLGGKIFRAQTGKEAVDYVVNLAKERGVKLIVKSKSLTSEEINLNEAIEEEGIQVAETDLGERIVQLNHERPSHLTAPAVHRTKEEVAQIFAKSIGKEVPADLDEIMKVARRTLRDMFLQADMGIVGVNVAVAETGSIIVVTNEGNERLVSSLPPLVVAIMGWEKLVGTMNDALNVLEVLPKSATGQEITSYVSFITGLSSFGDTDSREFHIVILDNGRTRMLEEGFKDALYCIRCAACMNTCPTFKVVGGHVFGHIYPGPIGIPWTSGVHSFEAAAEFSPLCISCGLCEEACPVSIDIPMMIAAVKQKDIEINGQLKVNRMLGDSETLARRLSSVAPLSNWILRRRLVKNVVERLTGIDKRRPFPSFQRNTFTKWFKTHSSVGEKKVAYFVDIFANYNDPEIGKSAVEVLEYNNVKVVLPEQRSSGMPYVSYGDLKSARDIAEFNIEAFAPLVKEGYEVVASEPTAAFCLKHVYPTLLKSKESELVAEHSHELFGYLLSLSSKGEFNTGFKRKFSGTIGYHQPCHSKPLTQDRPAAKILEMIGFKTRIIDHGCCGMAGTFGLKKGVGGYDLSMAVGEELFQDFKKGDLDYGVTESSVCRMQIEHGSGAEVAHPVRLLRDAYRG